MKKIKRNTKKKYDGQELKMGNTADDKSIMHFVRHFVPVIKV